MKGTRSKGSSSLLERLIPPPEQSPRPSPPPPSSGADDDDGDPVLQRQRKKPCGWKCMPYIIGNETLEKVASTGVTANMTVYLVEEMHLRQVTAANLATFFVATTYFATLAGAFVADACLGRFRTILYASLAAAAGMVVMTLIPSVPGLQPPPCPAGGGCAGPSSFQLAVYLSSLAMLVVGAGGIRPCSLAFGVDQFDVGTGEGIRDLAAFFNWYYFTTTAGTMAAMTAVVYIQDSLGWPVGFGVPAALMLAAIAFFLLGSRLYVHVPPAAGGVIFAKAARVAVAAFRKRALTLPAADDEEDAAAESMLYNPSSTINERLPLTNQFAFLNKAAIICGGELKEEDGTPASPWRLAGVQDVEELKCLIRIVPVWSAGLVAFLALSQQWSFAVLQALHMDRRIGGFPIPAGSLGTVSLAVVALFIPVYDRLLVPAARRVTGLDGGITTLQRQGVGMLISSVSMIVSGAVEARRRRESSAAAMSVLWLAPQLALMGVSEAFNVVGQMEFLNLEFPESSRSVAGSLFCCSLAGSGYLGAILVAVVRRNTGWLADDIDAGRLDYFYYLIAAMGVANLLYFVMVAHFYQYKASPEARIGE